MARVRLSVLGDSAARRGIATRLIDRAGPVRASRGKGLQPRRAQLFRFDEPGSALVLWDVYPTKGMRCGTLALPIGRLSKPVVATPSEPQPNLWMVPQFKTEELLRTKLESRGCVEHHTELRRFTMREHAVEAELDDATVRANFLVGCDGGKSLARKTLGLSLQGEALPGRGMVVPTMRLSDRFGGTGTRAARKRPMCEDVPHASHTTSIS